MSFSLSPFANFRGAPRLLPPGLIFELAAQAEIKLHGSGDKRACRCPFHDDRNASAFVSIDNIFFCSVCTPGGGISCRAFAQRLGLSWPPSELADATPSWTKSPPRPREASFTPAMADDVWRAGLARARDDRFAHADRAAYEYLRSRRLLESWELGAFGVLAPEMKLPQAVSSWAKRGYRVVAPLYDAAGILTNVQARAIIPAERKVLFPAGSVARGTLFACRRGLEVLRGTWTGSPAVLLAEGLTDYLGLAVTSPVPVLASPGTGIAPSAIGPWVKGRELVLALDWDAAGANAISPTAREAFALGATAVRRIQWPGGANDACAAIERIGVAELERFLLSTLVGGGA